MGTAIPVSVDDYLSTNYSPDVDFVDSELQERNVGEQDRARLQAVLAMILGRDEAKSNIRVLTEQRIQVKPNRFRVADVCVLHAPQSREQVLTRPPFLCIEILSPEDRWGRMQDRIADYLEMGVAYVWVISPQTRKAWICTAGAIHNVNDGVLKTQSPDLAVTLPELFQTL